MTTYSSSLERGIRAEERFVRFAERRGHRCVPSNRRDNVYRHTDYLVVVEDDHDWYVDVKARKRISRADESAQDREVWLEIRNVAGNNGWVYSPGYVAFEITEGFIVVPKYNLALLIHDKVGDTVVSNGRDALYKLYTRSGRKDLLTRVLLEDIKEIGEVWEE